MTPKARQRALQGSYATVDGIPFKMPINSLNSPALMVGFTVDYAQTAALLPGEEIKPVKLPRGRALMIITVIDYKKTDIGSYIEYSIAFACYHKRAGARFMGTFLAERTSAVGQYVWDLPVSTEISVKGGKGIWGMPKHRANLDFDVTSEQMSSQYDLDGELCMRITVPRPTRLKIPLRDFGATNYCQFRGMLMKSSVYFSDTAEVSAGRIRKAECMLGPHPRMDPLRTLQISDHAIFVACMPDSHGVLDDHYEGWFITAPAQPEPQPEEKSLKAVAGLPNTEDWLAPPTANGRPPKPGPYV